mgnify:CR=1 FL=1
MAKKNLLINKVAYEGVEEVKIPLQDGSGSARYLETSDATAAAGEILTGKSAYVNGELVAGSMPNNGATGGTIAKPTDTITIPAGYTEGGSVALDKDSADAIVAKNIKAGVTILGVEGDSNVVDTEDATAAAGEIITGKTAYVGGQKVTGSMASNGDVSEDITEVAQKVTVPAGYTTGGTVQIAAAEQAKIVSGNIKAGTTILGVEGKTSVVDTEDADAAAGDLLEGKTAYVNGQKVTGTTTLPVISLADGVLSIA